MSTDAGTALQSYLDALVAGDLDAIAASFAEDATWTLYAGSPLGGPKHGRDAIMAFLTGGAGMFRPGSQSFEFGDVTVQDDRAVLEWRVEGIGAATGRPYRNSYCGVFVLRDGLIVEVREYTDSAPIQDALFG